MFGLSSVKIADSLEPAVKRGSTLASCMPGSILESLASLFRLLICQVQKVPHWSEVLSRQARLLLM